MLRLVLLTTLVALSTPAHADSPAAIAETGRESAEIAFEKFAREWMDRVRVLEEKHRSNPTVKHGATDPIVTYRGFGDQYDIEMRATGNARAPWVGLLRYTEHIYSCASLEAHECSIASSMSVTEIFRYRDGRWSY